LQKNEQKNSRPKKRFFTSLGMTDRA